MNMAFKTSTDMMAMCRQIRERSGMTQVEFGASLDPPLPGQRIRDAEKDDRSRFDSIRVKILEQKGGYVIVPGFDVTRGKS